MVTHEVIKKELLKARQNSDTVKSTILNVLLGEYDRLKGGKKPAIISEVAERLCTSIQSVIDLDGSNDTLREELSILRSYFPARRYLSNSEVSEYLKSRSGMFTDIKSGMALLNGLQVDFDKKHAVEEIKANI